MIPPEAIQFVGIIAERHPTGAAEVIIFLKRGGNDRIKTIQSDMSRFLIVGCRWTFLLRWFDPRRLMSNNHGYVSAI